VTSPSLSSRSALVVGVGGLGCPASLALTRAGIGQLVLVDEDEVDESNLHRQILFRPDQVGMPKLDAARDSLVADGYPAERIVCVRGRLLPDNARGLVRDVDVVLEGADNYATKFLAADACHLEHTSVVHGAAIGWRFTVMAVQAPGRPCYRCLFEDLPTGDEHPSCATAGVMGPVVGLAGAVMAEFATRLLVGQSTGEGNVVTYDGRKDEFRSRRVGPRSTCALCGGRPNILDTAEARYLGATCAA